MKLLSWCLAGMLLFTIACMCSCSKNEKIRDGIFRGIYEGSNQMQELKHADKPTQSGKERPTYDQYKRERQEIITNHESDQPQHIEKSQ